MERVNYSITKETAIVFIDGAVFTVPSTHQYFREIIDLLVSKSNIDENEKVQKLRSYIDLKGEIERYMDGRITIESGKIKYKEEEIPMGVLQERILTMRKQGNSVEYLMKFLDNLMENPNVESRNDLYRFLIKNNLPITHNGNFLAYKKVNENYRDVHTNTFNNSIGSVVSMPRHRVNADRNVTCSTGFHAASYDYLDYYGGERVVIVEIRPQDVVSVPVDHGDAKLRCCMYTVVGEIEDWGNNRIRQGVVNTEEDDSFIEEYYEDYGDGEEDDFDDFFEEEEEENYIEWESNGAVKCGFVVDYINFLNNNTETINTSVTKKNTDIVQKYDRVLVKVFRLNDVWLDVPRLYAPSVDILPEEDR